MEQQAGAILAVDDNADNLALIRATLDDEGYEVICACNGDEALAAFRARPPDCVLLDVRMPGRDGIEVCRQLRDLPEGKDVPIVFLTAQREIDTFDRAMSAGGDDFLTKPIHPTTLLLRVQAALELRRMGTQLKQHYDLVRQQRDELMRLQLQKERLTAFVVHDLKNPVNSLDLHAQLLQRRKDLPAPARASVHAIRAEARSLLHLILNLLDISKSEAGQLQAQRAELDMKHMADSVLSALEVKAQAARVQLLAQIELEQLHADADLLKRVLDNLIENAIRHAPEGSEVRLHAFASPGHAEIRIIDQGPGISPELRDKVFEKFVQLDYGTEVVSRVGRGLGLSFCKLAVEAHGGKIWIEGDDRGAVFRLRLPNE